MKMTSDDCKNFLVKHFKQTDKQKTQWKRVAKYQVGSEVYRDFTHPHVGEVIVRENPLLVVGVNVSKSKTNVSSYQDEDDNYIAAHVSWLCDAHGPELVEGDPAMTLCECQNIDPDSLMLCGTEQGKDDDGNSADIYFFEDENTGRNYSLFVYEDSSWAYESD